MIPLRDNVITQRFPIMNVSLIFLNILVFLYQLMLPGEAAYHFVTQYGVIPVELTGGFTSFFSGNLEYTILIPGAILSLFTATFLHGGWLHLIGNMIYLWVFGDSIEDRLGSLRYLGIYLSMGAMGSIFHVLFNPLSSTPLIGASGAIAGVLGCYLLLYPRASILTLVPIGFFITFIHIPAILFLGIWFLLQLFNALGTQAVGAGAQSVAWWAHVGGFLVGLIMVIFLRAQQKIR